MTNVRDGLQLRYLRRMVKTPAGRAFLLNQLADAESNGENQVFEAVLSNVDDPALQKMIEKHRADEVRHAQLYHEAAVRQGVPLEPVPPHLKLIDRLDRAVGGFLTQPITDARGVMEAYVMLQVIEERATSQFTLLERAFREVDPQTADVVASICADEERHLLYCHAISKRYAPDEATRLETLHRYRELEARCFAENSEALMQHTQARGYFSGGPLVKWFWRNLQALGRRQGLPYTAYFAAAQAA